MQQKTPKPNPKERGQKILRLWPFRKHSFVYLLLPVFWGAFPSSTLLCYALWHLFLLARPHICSLPSNYGKLSSLPVFRALSTMCREFLITLPWPIKALWLINLSAARSLRVSSIDPELWASHIYRLLDAQLDSRQLAMMLSPSTPLDSPVIILPESSLIMKPMPSLLSISEPSIFSFYQFLSAGLFPVAGSTSSVLNFRRFISKARSNTASGGSSEGKTKGTRGRGSIHQSFRE